MRWSNAPAAQGSMLASLGAVSASTWYEVDVTSLVTGDGTYSLRISSTSTNGADYSSKEGTNAPELVLTLGGTPPPTNTSTPGPSPTPTRTPTATPVATNTPPPRAFSSATFVYDGDGKRVKSIFNSTITTYFVGNHYEVANGVVTKYYYAGTQRIAMRVGSTLNFLIGDHLGSTSLTTSSTGTVISELRYKAWGETRYASGTTPTKYQYTGQFSYTSDFGLMYYGARWYDPNIGRFNQPDTIIPPTQGVQAWDRYAYSNNNPVKYTDPSGNWIETAFDLISLGMTLNDIRNEGMTVMNAISLVTDVASVVLPIVPAGVSHAIRAAKIANKLANTADMAADTIKVVNKASDARTFYHATNAAGAKSILEKGIDLAKGRLDLDFNPAGKKGFYVTELLDQAKGWASKYGDDGRIVQFKVPQKKLDELSGKIFASGDSNWLDFVSAGRDGKLHHAYDYVEGPYLGLKTRQPYGHQLAIFTKKAVNLFNNSIFGIVR